MVSIFKSHNHDHFWVADNVVFESYNTARGLRSNGIAIVDFPDKDELSDEDVEALNEQLAKQVETAEGLK